MTGPEQAPVRGVADAVARARQQLADAVVIPAGAERDLASVDSAAQASAWGASVWRGLQALADYVRAKRAGEFEGGFWVWCERGGGWPATPKRLALRESATVEARPKMRNARVFPVAVEVDASGRAYMGAHLKISEGGGARAPRVYFLDDTGGVTGRVHVGLVGPHSLVPNTKT